MEITKEQVQEYISKNFDTFFVEALAKYIKDVMFIDNPSNEVIEDYREEFKQLIWDGIAHGTKSYLEDNEAESFKILSKEFLNYFSKKDISISFTKN